MSLNMTHSFLKTWMTANLERKCDTYIENS